ncbi:uncharacterized protein LOC112590463 [Harpegnathos saltator]|nr:uncharacterized protein LOC112590079 [Harpegnathos saltator]XP_025162734.1 uncharacterized protein LOC112590463 [Harpegnathos saltator]
MTKYCVVPKCKTGCKSVAVKCSVFKVPKCDELRKKWISAIPGIKDLKPNQCVCEKHFDKASIIRELVMRDAQGNVVTEAKYLRTRLFKSAVPTIFYEFSSTTLVSKDEDLQEEKLGVDAASNGSLNSDVHCTLSKSIEITLPIPQSVDVTSKYYHALLYSTNSNSNPAIDSYSDDIDEFLLSESTNVNTENLSAIDCQQSKKETNDFTDCERISDSVDLKLMKSISMASYKDSLITIPKSWSFTESYRGTKRYLIFSHVWLMTNNDTDGPIIDKSVIIDDVDGTIDYKIFGKSVDIQEIKILQNMNDVTSLHAVLSKFESMPVCQGVGPVEECLIQRDIAYRTSCNVWHHTDCELTTKTKRCKRCTILKNTLLQKKARFKKRDQVKRVVGTTNPIDLKKINALRKKLSVTRRMKNRSKIRIALLQDQFISKQNELANIQDETLEKKYVSLNIPKTMQNTLMEIITSAKHMPHISCHIHSNITFE